MTTQPDHPEHASEQQSEPTCWIQLSPVIDRRDADLVGMFTRQTDRVNVVAFAPEVLQELGSVPYGADKVLLTSKNQMGEYLVFALGSPEMRMAFGLTKAELRQEITTIVCSPDGRYVFSGLADHTARLWDTQTEAFCANWRDLLGEVSSVAIDIHGHHILAISQQGIPNLLECKRNGRRAMLQGHSGNITSVIFSPDGSLVLTGLTDEKRAYLWVSQTGELCAILQGHIGQGTRAAFSPDGKQILTREQNDTMCLWDSQTGKCLATFQGLVGEVDRALFKSGQRQILTGSTSDNRACLWDGQTGELIATIEGHKSEVTCAVFSPDGRLVLTGSQDPLANLWSSQTGRVRTMLRGQTKKVSCVAFSLDGTLALTGSSDTTACLWECETGELRAILQGHTGEVTSVAFHPDGAHLLTSSWDGTACVWDGQTGKLLTTLQGHTRPVDVALFSPNGKQILTGAWDGTARLWDSQTGHLQETLPGHSGWVRHLGYSSDGKHVLTAASDHHNLARLWDSQTGELQAAFTGHSVSCFAFFSENQLLIIGSDDHTVCLWDSHTGSLLWTLHDHEFPIRMLSFSPDERFLLTSDLRGQILFWRMQGRDIPRLLSRTETARIVAAVYWHNATHLMLAEYDLGAFSGTPFLYHLSLEGQGWL